MEPKDDGTNAAERQYKAQIAELKARFIAEKEELTSLFLDKLKEVENYHKKMLQDLVIKSSSDLDAIQAKHEEKLKFLATVHSKEIDTLQTKIDQLLSDKKELKEMLTEACEEQVLPKEKILSYLKNDSASTINQ